VVPGSVEANLPAVLPEPKPGMSIHAAFARFSSSPL